MNTRLILFTFLMALVVMACTNSEDTQPIDIDDSRGTWPVLDLDPCLIGNCDEPDTVPPAFNLSLAFEHYQTNGNGMETGTISIGINRTLAHDLKVQVNYYARIPSSLTINPPYIPFNPIIPVNPEFTIPAGSTISEFIDITPEMYSLCKTKVEYKLKMTAVQYGDWVVDPSVYTFISDPNGEAKRVLKNPLASNNCQDGDPGLIDDISCMIAGRPCLPGDF